MVPPKKKSGGVRSGELAGQRMGPPLPIQFSPNWSVNSSRAVRLKCGGALSCWNHNRNLSFTGTIASSKSFSSSCKKVVYISPFNGPSKKKKRLHNSIVDNTSPDIKEPAILDVLFSHPMRILYCPIV
jgi:hypothetical protein